MISNCLITDSEFYHYEIKDTDGNLIANAHTLTYSQNQECASLKAAYVDDKLQLTVTSEKDNLKIKYALDSWQFADKANNPLPITLDNIDGLLPKYKALLLRSINDHEDSIVKETKEIEKN